MQGGFNLNSNLFSSSGSNPLSGGKLWTGAFSNSGSASGSAQNSGLFNKLMGVGGGLQDIFGTKEQQIQKEEPIMPVFNPYQAFRI